MEKLGINLSHLIIQFINFGVLLALLLIFAYRPLRRIFEERSRKIREGLEQAELARKRMEEVEEEVRRRLEEARRQGEEIIARAREAGEKMKAEAREEARKEAEIFMERAREEMRRERAEMVEQLRREFVDAAILAAQKVVREALDKERHRRLIEETLEEISTLKG